MRKGKQNITRIKASRSSGSQSPAKVDFGSGVVFQGVEQWRKYLSWKRGYAKLDPEVREALPRDRDVNEVLRHYVEITKIIGAAKRRRSA